MIDTALPAALNHLLARAQWARSRLQPYAGRQLTLDVQFLRLGLVITDSGLLSPATTEPPGEVLIRFPPETPWLLIQGIDRVIAAVQVEGNAEFAEALSFVFRNLRWDAEEDMAQLIGDIAAHRIGEVVRHVAAVPASGLATLGENLSDYLSHEQSLCIRRSEFGTFSESVRELDRQLGKVEITVATLG